MMQEASSQASAPKGSRFRRWTVRLWRIICGATLVLLIAAIVFASIENLRGAAATRRIERRLVELGLPDPDELWAVDGELEYASDNAARWHRAATILASDDEMADGLPIVRHSLDDPEDPELGEPYPTDMLELIGARLKRQAPLFALIERAVSCEAAEFGIKPGVPYDAMAIHGQRPIVMWLRLKAEYGACSDEPALFAEAVEDQVAIAGQMEEMQMDLPEIMRGVLLANAVLTVERGLSLTSLTDAQLDRLDVALRMAESSLDVRGFSRMNLAETVYWMRNPHLAVADGHWGAETTAVTFKDVGWGEPDFYHYSKYSGAMLGNYGGDLKPVYVPGFSTRTGQWIGHTWVLMCPGAFERRAARTCARQIARLEEMAQTTQDAWSVIHRELTDGPSSGTHRVSPRVGRMVFEVKAELRLAIALIAAERFRLAHGRWPQTMDELGDSNVPADPYTGEALRLRRTERGLTVYSVGGDLQDDGGVDIKKPYEPDQNADRGLELLDPEFRGRVTRRP